MGGPVGRGQNLSERVFRFTELERKSLSRGGDEERIGKAERKPG